MPAPGAAVPGSVAGFANFAGGSIRRTGNLVADTAVRDIIGGKGAVLGGGKFRNGAYSSAFAYALAHGPWSDYSYAARQARGGPAANNNDPGIGHNGGPRLDELGYFGRIAAAARAGSPLGAFLAILWPTTLGDGSLIQWGKLETLEGHFIDHGADFGATDSFDYALKAREVFLAAQANGYPTKSMTPA